MTTATTKVVKEDLVTPADPFDDGAGRVDLTKAGDASLVFEDAASNYFVGGQDPVAAVQLNVPSVNAPTMPGTITVTRTAKNLTGRDVEFRATTKAPSGSTIRVTPSEGTVRAGRSQSFRITITSSAPAGQYFGEIDIAPKVGPALHLPVAFFNQQGAVSLSSACSPSTIKAGATTTCTVTATNQSFDVATVQASTSASASLKVVGATGATVSGGRASAGPVSLAGKKDATPAISSTTSTPGGGFLDLGLFGITPTAVGDETIANYNVPGFVFAGRTYTKIGVTSDGYAVAGGGDQGDVQFVAQTLPDPARPNGVLAPYWSDLDGGSSPGIRLGVLSGGGQRWLVVQWDVHVWGDTSAAGQRSFQLWLGLNGTEDISYEYAANAQGASVPATIGPLTVGAENGSGTGGAQITGAPSGSYAITSTPGAPGGSLTYTVTVRGADAKPGQVVTDMTASLVPGHTIVSTPVTVTR
jgi:hypothetical protein